eukprot:CAMPEP_0171978878 /NCGR_PEP_ID=MMETSP0993-20121228/254308_1 /TAXON_ID=483369 /ORGANISM="non described non described, Strain CCMP2098" /LENGTH=341 /DNA_ID=CAMNT_0012630883 /DNA_START=94 /DNA_END=1117 /DNA_ORIENTATION=-
MGLAHVLPRAIYFVLILANSASALVTFRSPTVHARFDLGVGQRSTHLKLCAEPEKDIIGSDELFGGFTAKQRLREEIESPFRKVRLFFFGSSAASALLALYFSVINAGKAYVGGWPDAPPLDDALGSCAINIGAFCVCAAITYNDVRRGEKSLTRIAKGGALAALVVSPASGDRGGRTTLTEYRREARVLIAAGGEEYVSVLTRSLMQGGLASQLASVDLVIVPVLLERGGTSVGDARSSWAATAAEMVGEEAQVAAAAEVAAFPVGSEAWVAYLGSEIETAKTQGFDVLDKGITIAIKKNGRVLRRATGQPQWEGIVGTMEVMDGSKFGMPGDDKYNKNN